MREFKFKNNFEELYLGKKYRNKIYFTIVINFYK